MSIKQLNEELSKVLNEKLYNRYMVFYDADSYHKNNDWYDIQYEDWFTEERGYSKRDIDRIKSLSLGEYYCPETEVSGDTAHQVIIRVKTKLY